MSSIKCNEVIIAADHIQAGRGKLFHRDTAIASVDNLHAARDHIKLRQHTVEQYRAYTCHPVHQHYLQCLCFLRIRVHGGQPFQIVFSVFYAVALIAEVTAVRPVRILDNARRRTVVACPQGRELLRQRIHGISLIISRVIRISGKSSVIIGQKVIHTSFRALSII